MRQEALLGLLELGKKADLIVLDTQRAHLVPAGRILSAWINNGQPSDIESVLVDGQFIMRDRKILTVDETSPIAEADKVGRRSWSKVEAATLLRCRAYRARNVRTTPSSARLTRFGHGQRSPAKDLHEAGRVSLGGETSWFPLSIGRGQQHERRARDEALAVGVQIGNVFRVTTSLGSPTTARRWSLLSITFWNLIARSLS